MSYLLKGKLESVKYSSDANVSKIKIVPVGEYTLRLGNEKYCIIVNDSKTKAKMIGFNEYVYLSKTKEINQFKFSVGEIISFEFTENEIYDLESDKGSTDIKVGEIKSIEVFA